MIKQQNVEVMEGMWKARRVSLVDVYSMTDYPE
jgi:hypothetical protein